MTYNVFAGMLNLSQSVNQLLREIHLPETCTVNNVKFCATLCSVCVMHMNLLLILSSVLWSAAALLCLTVYT